MTNHPNRAVKMRCFNVDADRETGEWIASSLKECDPVVRSEFYALGDSAKTSNDFHFDTFEHNGETCAIVVKWID